MLDVNKYKASTKKFILFLFISFSTLTFVYKSINFTDYLDKEIQAFQSYFSSFSSIKQLVDNGELNSLYDMTLENYFELSKKIPKIALHKSKNLLNEQDDNKISIKIDFKYLNKINDERKKALKIGINHKPNYYPCSISYQSKTYKCKVRLKGVFKDHWRSLKRMSLKIKLKDGFIEGINEFSIQKPRTRQFPYDFAFQKFISNFNIQGSDNQIFIRVMVNNDEWGVMNMEEAITDKFIERRNIKRNGVYNIGNLDFLYYDLLQDTYSEYYLSNPLIHIYPKTKFWKFSNHKYLQENFTYIFENISNKNFKIFDRKMMIMAYLLNLSWGDLHTLYYNNSSYSWNTYTKKLEPILTDQVNWKKIDYDNIVNLIHSTPSTYKLLFLNDPLSEKEFIDTLNVIKVNFLGVVDCVKSVEEYFKSRKSGHISIVSSIAGYRGLPNSSGYGPSKAALTNFCESIYFDFKKFGVRVSIISPGFIKTSLTEKNEFPMPFLKNVDYAADKIFNGLVKSNSFEIHFPKGLTLTLKFLRILPIKAYLFLVDKLVKR